MRTMIKLIGLMVLAMCELGGMPLASHAQGSVQILSHIRSGDGFGLHDLRLIERPHVHVAWSTMCSGDVAQPRCGQVEAGLAVRESADDTGSAPDLSHDPLERIVGADLLPVDVREGVVGQRLGHAALDEVGRRAHSGGRSSSTIAWAFGRRPPGSPGHGWP